MHTQRSNTHMWKPKPKDRILNGIFFQRERQITPNSRGTTVKGIQKGFKYHFNFSYALKSYLSL